MSNRAREWADIWGPTLLALLAALAAVASAISACEDNRQSWIVARAAAEPYLTIIYNVKGNQSGFTLESRGPGVADIGYLQVTVDGAEVENWLQVANQLGFSEPLTADLGNVDRGERVPANDKRTLFWVVTRPEMLLLHRTNSRVEVAVCYCSIFRECWLSSSKAMKERLGGVSCEKPTAWKGGVAARNLAPTP